LIFRFLEFGFDPGILFFQTAQFLLQGLNLAFKQLHIFGQLGDGVLHESDTGVIHHLLLLKLDD
jgi:hypothetical protein